MVHFNGDSSESEEKELFTKKTKLSPIRKSEESFKTHGIVVGYRSPIDKKSPPKQLRNKKENDSSDNTGNKLKSPSKLKSRQNIENENENENISDDEKVDRSNTKIIKKENSSSDDDDSENEIPKSPNDIQIKNYLLDESDDDESVPKNQNESINVYDIKKSGDDSSQDIDEKIVKKGKIFIKQEVISSEDEDTLNHKDSGILTQRNNLSKFENSQECRGGDNSDSEIQPSQFWLNKYKETDKNEDEKEPAEVNKKSSPFKNLNLYEKNEKKKPSLKSKVNTKKELSQRKSPPRITKTEIISTKFRRTDSQISKDREESDLEDNRYDAFRKKNNEMEGSGGWKESYDYDDSSNDRRLIENEKFEGNKSGESKLEGAWKELSDEESSLKKKRQSPKKTVNASSPKRKLSLGAKTLNNDSGIEKESNVKETKNSPKKKLDNQSNDEPFQIRPNVCDEETSNEKEEPIGRNKSPKKCTLGLEKPKPLNKKSPKSNGKQMLLVLTNNDEILENNESNSSDRKLGSPRKISSLHHNGANDKDSLENISSNEFSSSKMEKKVSPKKKNNDNDISNEEKACITKAAAIQKQEMIKNRKSVGSGSDSLKRKLEDSDDSSSNEETPAAEIVVKTPMRRKHPESNSSVTKSNKRAKLTPLTKQQPDHHAMSDSSDDNDSLTKLNTTLNKSMALMENKSEIVTLNKSRKSVSINTKHEIVHTPNESKTRKSILKKPAAAAQVVANDNSESSSDAQEQTVQEILQPIHIVTPKIIRRPINLENLIHQENLSYENAKASFSLEDVSDDDEIYILEVPKTVDPRKLKGQTIKLRGKNKLRIGDQLYETSSRDGRNISCIFRTDEEQSSYQTVNLRPAGCINLRQRLSKSLHVELSSVEKKTVPFPEKLKIRHPLFGAEYEDKILIKNGKKVSKQISRSIIKREESITRTNEKTNEIEKKPIKLKNIEKSVNQKIELPEELNESKNNSKVKFQRSLQLDGSDSASSDSDTDASFFQKVQLERSRKYEKRKKSKTVSSDLDLDESTSIMNEPVNSDEMVIDVKQKASFVNNKKLGSSLNSSVLRNNGFLLDEKESQFFSSTPIKIENDERTNTDSEILTKKIRKRKTNDDGISKLTKTPKKVKKTNSSMPAAFEKKKSNVSI